MGPKAQAEGGAPTNLADESISLATKLFGPGIGVENL